MIETKKDFALKHREDVIDILHLRAKERRLFYGLLLILSLTLVYENGSSICAGLLTEKFATATLGERQKLTIKPEVLKKVARSLDALVEEYPQFANRLNLDVTTLQDAIKMSVIPEQSEQTIEKSRQVVRRLFEFVSHPGISRNKILEAMDKELKPIAKLLQINLVQEFEINPVSFKKTAAVVESNGQRNLFEFN